MFENNNKNKKTKKKRTCFFFFFVFKGKFWPSIKQHKHLVSISHGQAMGL